MLVWILALCLLVLVNKKKLVVYVFLSSSILNGFHYYISLEKGKEGLSVLTKELLDDEVIYAFIPKKACDAEEFYSPKKFMEFSQFYQQKYSGYISIAASRLSYVSYLLFKFFGADYFILKTLICVFFSLMISSIKQTFLTLNVLPKKATLYALIVALIPNLLIRSIQIEKDVILLYLSFLILNRLLQKRSLLFSKLGIFLGALFFLRPYFALVFLLSKIRLANKFFFQRHLIHQLSLLFFGVVLFITILKIVSPSMFNLLVAIKSYSVLNGFTNIIEVDYTNIFGIIKTYLESLYYFFFSPISIYLLNGSMLWKLLALEPLFFFIMPTFIIVLRYKNLSHDFRLQFIVGLAILIAFIILGFESHFTSVMRKRIFTYMLICITAITLNHRYPILNEKDKK